MAAGSFTFGAKFGVVAILRMDCRCSSVAQLLCAVLWIVITESSFSHRYVLPNMHKVRVACRRSWGIPSGMEGINCAVPAVSPFAVSVPLHSIKAVWDLSAQSAQFISKVRILERHCTNLVRHFLATGKMRQVALMHVCEQPHLKCFHSIVHVSDHAVTSREDELSMSARHGNSHFHLSIHPSVRPSIHFLLLIRGRAAGAVV